MSSSPTARRPGRRKVLLLGSYAPSLINFRGPLIARHGRARARGVRRGARYRSRRRRQAGRARRRRPCRSRSAGPASTRSPPGGAAGSFERWSSEIAPDVMIAYTIKPVVLGAVAARAARVPCFAAMITGMGYAFLGGPQPEAARHPPRRDADVPAGAGRVAARHLPERGRSARLQAAAAPPADRPSAHRQRLGSRSRSFRARSRCRRKRLFLMIARYLRDKGIREYGAAAARLKAEYPEVRVRLAGWLDEVARCDRPGRAGPMVAGGSRGSRQARRRPPAIAASTASTSCPPIAKARRAPCSRRWRRGGR